MVLSRNCPWKIWDAFIKSKINSAIDFLNSTPLLALSLLPGVPLSCTPIPSDPTFSWVTPLHSSWFSGVENIGSPTTHWIRCHWCVPPQSTCGSLPSSTTWIAICFIYHFPGVLSQTSKLQVRVEVPQKVQRIFRIKVQFSSRYCFLVPHSFSVMCIWSDIDNLPSPWGSG